MLNFGFQAALNDAAKNNDVIVVAITGEGEFYSSGNDMSAMLIHDDIQQASFDAIDIIRKLVRAFFTFPKVLISVVNGPCIGITATTAILCDVVYASETVR